MTADLALLRAAVRDLVRPRKVAAALLLALLPAGIAAIWRTNGAGFHADIAYNVLAGDLIFGFVLVILAVLFATGVLSQEVDGKTIVYLLTRPIARWRVLLVKFVVAVLGVTATACFAALLLAIVSFGPSGLGGSPFAHDCGILLVGAMAYGALFLLLAVVFRRPLLIGLLFAFGWESWTPNLPGSFQQASLMAYVRTLAPHPKPPSETIDLDALLTAANPQTIAHATAWWVVSGVAAVALVAALILFSIGEFAPRDDAE